MSQKKTAAPTSIMNSNRLMNIKRNARFAGVLLLCAMFPEMTRSQQIPGVPEPGLILYGQIRNAATGNSLLTYGTLRWTIQLPSGSPITVGTTLTNINDQFSYLVRIPFESVLSGFTLSANTLALSSSPVIYSR